MKKKDMNFLQASTIYDLPLFADADKDKVPNIFDCKPFDSSQDGLFGRAVNLVSRGRYGQSKEEYDAEKISHTQFIRDEGGKVIRTIRNGQVVEPDNLKTSKQLLEDYQQKLYGEKIKKQKEINALIQQQIEMKKLQIKKQKLRSQLNPQLSPAQLAISSMFGVPSRPGPSRPGYYIERSPKLPKGYRWKKIPKSKKSKEVKNNCPRCNIPLVPVPNFQGQIQWICPRCGLYYI